MFLTLPIVKRWFDMILSGQKKEEYREIKPYWTSRFRKRGLLDSDNNPTNKSRWITLKNGYSKSSPSFDVLVRLTKGHGKPEWGAEREKEYYILQILQISQCKARSMSMERISYVLRINDNGYFEGKTYQFRGAVYACECLNPGVAKHYRTFGSAKKGKEALLGKLAHLSDVKIDICKTES